MIKTFTISSFSLFFICDHRGLIAGHVHSIAAFKSRITNENLTKQRMFFATYTFFLK